MLPLFQATEKRSPGDILILPIYCLFLSFPEYLYRLTGLVTYPEKERNQASLLEESRQSDVLRSRRTTPATR